MQINLKQLKYRCNAKISSFQSLGETVSTQDGNYIYIDNGAPVLAVAHLDTVNNDEHFYHNQFGKDHVVYSTALDDRLGAYILLDYLPKLVGQKAYDILLTEGEETGNSTAYYFTPSHNYNWMFQFDRHGDDVVMYEYESKESLALLKDYNFKAYPGAGSFSDISCMDFLKIVGFNFGCGYEDNHSIRSYAEIDVTEMMVKKFVKFFKENKDIYMPAPIPTYSYGLQRYRKGDYKDYGALQGWGETQGTYGKFITQDVGDCVNCQSWNVDVDEDGLCETCSKSFDEALNKYPITKEGNYWSRCSSCSKWSRVDEYGVCESCNEYFDSAQSSV